MPGHKSSKPYSGLTTGHPTSKFLDTTGNSTLAIGICQRCQMKFALGDLQDDPNIPNFKVCRADRDDFDPYRMAPRPADIIAPPFVRPDVPLDTPPTPPWEQ